MLGRALQVIFAPIGFNWQISHRAGAGPGGARSRGGRARHGVCAVGSGDDVSAALAPVIARTGACATALSLLAWYVFAPQCLSTLAAVKRETNSWRYPLIMAGYLFAMAYAGIVPHLPQRLRWVQAEGSTMLEQVLGVGHLAAAAVYAAGADFVACSPQGRWITVVIAESARKARAPEAGSRSTTNDPGARDSSRAPRFPPRRLRSRSRRTAASRPRPAPAAPRPPSGRGSRDPAPRPPAARGRYRTSWIFSPSGGRVLLVVAAEAARRLLVADVIRVGVPGDLHRPGTRSSSRRRLAPCRPA